MFAIAIHVVGRSKVHSSNLTEQHVVEDEAIASSTGNPTLKAYLEAEAALDFLPVLVTQEFVVTADAGDVNGAS